MAKKKAAPEPEPEVAEAPAEAPKPTVADLRVMAEALYADALASPGDGVLVLHLREVVSALRGVKGE